MMHATYHFLFSLYLTRLAPSISVLTSCSVLCHLHLSPVDEMLCNLKNYYEHNPMEAAMAVAQKAASNGAQQNSHNVIQTATNMENHGPNTSFGNSVVAVSSSPRPNSAPTISTEPISTFQDHASLSWNRQDTTVPQTESHSVLTDHPSMICVVGKKRPCDPMSDVISSHGAPANVGTYLNNTLSTPVTFSPPGLPTYVSPGNYSQHPHAKNAAVLQATLLSSQQPIMVFKCVL